MSIQQRSETTRAEVIMEKKHEDKEIQSYSGYINVVNLRSWIARLYTHEDLECTTRFF